MRLALLTSILIVSGLLSGDLAASSVSDEQQILQREDDWAHALESKDRAAFDRILTPDFTFIEPDGSVLEREAYLADRSKGPMQVNSFEAIGLRVRVYGNSALVTGLSRIDETGHGKRYRYQLRWKELWLKNPSGWQVRAGQATPINAGWMEPFEVSK